MDRLIPNGLFFKNFRIKPLPGKGAAAFATRDFKKGEIILSECPLFTQPLKRNHRSVSVALSMCSDAQKRMYYSLNNCHDVTVEMTKELGIFESNVIPCGGNNSAGQVATKGGLFIIGSRFNTSCTPNVNNHWDESIHQLIFRAARDIKAGEEYCIAYGNVLQGRAERQRELKMKFKFMCSCQACCLSGAALEASDQRRHALGVLLSKHSDGMCANAYEGLAEVLYALRFIAEEGLTVYESSFYFFGFHLCAASSDYKSAREWAVKARDASLLMFGDGLQEIYRRLIADPGCYPDADTMTKMSLAGPDSPSWDTLGLGLGRESD